jgi:chemotaxis protein CheD
MWHGTARPALKTRYIVAGEAYATIHPVLITTVLGSCVSVCLWDQVTGIGGMNHFMLPRWDGKGVASNRFGDISTRGLIRKMLYMGVHREELQARVFGGASPLGMKGSKHQAGRGNVEIAFDILKNENIRVVESKVGGPLGKKVVFNTANGFAIVRPVGQQVVQNLDRL